MARIKLQYFKSSGKWGYEGELEWADDKSMYGLIDHVKDLNRNRKLPGLASGSWDGPIYLNTDEHPMGYPLLILE